MKPSVSAVHTTLCAVILAIYFSLIFPISQSFPYTDDWMYVVIHGTGWRSFARWLFAQHVDHRVPFMKAAQYAVLWWAGFDFRAVMALNAAAAVAGVFAFFYAARRYRGFSHFGDLIIPLILLNLGFGLFGWGSLGQFVYAVTASAIFLALFGRALDIGSNGTLATAYLFLLVCACTAVHGLIVAVIVAGVLFGTSFVTETSGATRAVRGYSGAILVLSVTILLFWTPSEASASSMRASGAQYANWIYQLSKSSFIISAFKGGWWRAALMVGLAAGAATAALRRSSAGSTLRLSLFETAVHATFFGYLALGAAIVVGRAANSEWSAGMEMHYGYLVAPVPILGWLIVSRETDSRVSFAVAVILVGLYAEAWKTGVDWRLNYARSRASHVAQVALLLRSSTPASELARRYMSDFYYIDAPLQRQTVEVGIEKLRQLHGEAAGSRVP